MKHYIQTVDMTDGGDRDQMKFWDLSARGPTSQIEAYPESKRLTDTVCLMNFLHSS